MSTADPMDITGDLEPPSKSQRKREMTALQELGEKLVELAPDTLKKLPLDEALLDCLLEAQRITQREARRRQLQRVGKLMRSVDAEAIQLAYDNLQSGSQEATRRLHTLERWRDRLLGEGDAAIGEALAAFPGVEAQVLRQYVREARREQASQKPPAAARKLFQYLRQHLA